ncbi:HD domain-containing protein [Prolixibacter sp. SD074]|jgi:hypothetical protein|uniref:HD domain-containing protein n=1 Tax=Prolixibacter sp. SD074 TaxID=2652391 RepID=UPI00127E3FC2|nr:HD domain-containing protein [Prolixibacter sp. SD074]GET28276.1 metal-dependent phosphohydrolase [Prolixibacter sp. SD074]
MISQKTLEQFREEYNQILSSVETTGFTQQQQTFEQWKTHNEKVVENILLLGQSLDMEDGEMRMAEILALFHDIARFRDVSTSPYYPKLTETGHAEAGAELLSLLPPFKGLEAAKQEILQKVTIFHNKPELPKKENELVLYYLKLLRDADKLDALRMTAEFLTFRDVRLDPADTLHLSKSPAISDNICKAIINDMVPKKEEIVTYNDYVLMQLSWVFELTYRKTYLMLNQRQYIKRLYDALPKNDNIIDIYRKIRIHIENQLF